jgi:tetratricopeptide (TPR) repeat protein/predicted transcriptional regulator
MDASELLTILTNRHALLEHVIESDEPPPKQTLIETLDYSRSTVNRVVRNLRDRGLLQSGDDELTETLVARLVWEQYRTLDRRIAAIGTTETDDPHPWPTDAERREAIRLLVDRHELLECLVAGPHEKRDLVAAVESTQSTVDRAVRELEVAGFVRRPTAGYTLSPPVQQATQQYRLAVEQISDILAAQDFLGDLPPDCPIESPLLADATVADTTDAPPYQLPTGLQDRLGTAEHVRLCLPVLSTPLLLDTCQRQVIQEGVTIELLTPPALFETLTAELPGPLAMMASASTGSCAVHVADSLPSFGIVLSEINGATTVSVISYSDHQTTEGVIYNDTAGAVEWAEKCYADACTDATERTAALRELEPAHHARAPTQLTESASERVDFEAEGIVQLTPEYFAQRAPVSPLTGWRAGFDLVDVHAGYALDREIERDDTRHNLTAELIDALATDTNQAVLGPPGAGKSTVCQSVACRWYEQGLGPVFYRESGTGAPFESPTVLREQVRTAATRGHVLVVVEDAVRAEANAIFEVMQAFRGDETVTFLLDAREGEWTDPEALSPDARRAAYREDAIETVFVPALDATETERFIRQFARTTNQALEPQIAHHLREQGIAEDKDQSETQSQPSGEAPGELLLLLHRLVLAADPLASYSTHTPTTLVEDVQRTYAMLDNTGPPALDVGVLVNLLNAAGIGVHPALVCALAATEDEPTIAAIREALSTLEGRIIFDREETHGAASGLYRTIHAAWSAQFLEYSLERETEHAAHQRVGECVTALLSLADDEELRTRIRAAVPATGSRLAQIETAPDEWADITVEQLFSLGRSRPGLAPLFGTTGNSSLILPEACSRAITVECTTWRATMFRKMGAFDRATHEYDALGALADEVEGTDPDWAATLRGRRLNGHGIVAKLQSEFDNAEAFYMRAIEQYQEADNRYRLAQTRMHLGNVARDRSERKTAEACYRQSIDTFRDLGDTQGEANVLLNLGTLSSMTNELSTVIEQFRECLDLYRDLSDRRREAITLSNLGYATSHKGDLDTAESYCTQALNRSRESGARDFEAYSLHTSGLVYRMRGDFETAEMYYEQSRRIFQEIGNRRLKAEVLVDLSVLARERGALKTATDQCQTGHDIMQEIGERRGEARSLVTLGTIAYERSDVATAVGYGQESHRVCQVIDPPLETARTRRLLGQVAGAREQFPPAEDHLTNALNVFQELEYRYEEAKTLAALGVLARCRAEPVNARKRFAKAVELFREMGAIRDTIETTEQLAAVCLTVGERETAREHCETGQDLAQATEFIDVSLSLDERWD